MIRLLLIYLVVLSVITFVVYGIDKLRARRHKYRIPESTLLLLAVFGGSVGALLGIYGFRHKTRHKKFTIGVPAILFAQVAVALWMYSDPY